MNYREALDWTNRLRAPDEEAARRMDYVTGRGQVYAPTRGPVPSPPREDIAADSPFTRLVFPPRIEKIATSTDFKVKNFAFAVPAGAGTVNPVTNVRFVLPQSMVGWLQQFQLYILGSLATTQLRWTVRINQGPVPGFDAEENPPGAANIVLITTNEMRIRVPMAGAVDVTITNVDGAAVTAGAMLAGWYHPLADELRTYGEGA